MMAKARRKSSLKENTLEPAPLEPTQVKLLTDKSLEIPLWLRRNPDGTFVFPGAPIPMVVTEAVTTPADPVYPRLNEHDLEVIAQLRAAEGNVSQGKKAEEKLRRDERKRLKAAEKERLRANKMRQRQIFHQHFKWDYEQ